MVRILALSHYFKGKSTKYSHYSHGQSERTASGKPNSCETDRSWPHCAVLNYLGPVAPYHSIRDGKIRLNHAELHRTGWSYCATYYKIAESAESAERRRKARKRRKTQKGTFWGDLAKKSLKSAAAQLVVDWAVRSVPGLQRKLYIINKL